MGVGPLHVRVSALTEKGAGVPDCFRTDTEAWNYLKELLELVHHEDHPEDP
jgi:hypothetical protein